jgi:hypothetical protein
MLDAHFTLSKLNLFHVTLLPIDFSCKDGNYHEHFVKSLNNHVFQPTRKDKTLVVAFLNDVSFH